MLLFIYTMLFLFFILFRTTTFHPLLLTPSAKAMTPTTSGPILTTSGWTETRWSLQRTLTSLSACSPCQLDGINENPFLKKYPNKILWECLKWDQLWTERCFMSSLPPCTSRVCELLITMLCKYWNFLLWLKCNC